MVLDTIFLRSEVEGTRCLSEMVFEQKCVCEFCLLYWDFFRRIHNEIVPQCFPAQCQRRLASVVRSFAVGPFGNACPEQACEWPQGGKEGTFGFGEGQLSLEFSCRFAFFWFLVPGTWYLVFGVVCSCRRGQHQKLPLSLSSDLLFNNRARDSNSILRQSNLLGN